MSTPSFVSKFGHVAAGSPLHTSNPRTLPNHPNSDLTANLTALYSEISRNKPMNSPISPNGTATHQKFPVAVDTNRYTNADHPQIDSIRFKTFGAANSTANSEILSNKFETFIAYSKASNDNNNSSSETDKKPISLSKDDSHLAKLPPVPKRMPSNKSGINRSNTLKHPAPSTRPSYLNQIDFHPTQNNVVLENLNFKKFSSEKDDRQFQIADNLRYGTLKSNTIVCQELNKPILKSLNANYDQNL
jgi:hypothetical protein